MDVTERERGKKKKKKKQREREKIERVEIPMLGVDFWVLTKFS